jgi:hypothetical protein
MPRSSNPYGGIDFNQYGDNYPGNRYASQLNTTPFGNRFAYGYGGEPSLRRELFNTLEGDMLETPKARPALIRKARLGTDGKPIPCSCVDKNTSEPDRDTWCDYCQSESWYWDEIWMECYRVHKSAGGGSLSEQLAEPGLVLVHQVDFYILANAQLSEIESYDRIVEVELDCNGIPSIPHRRRELYRIGSTIDFRLDHGKLEYWKCETYTEIRKYLNGPGE